MPGDNVSMAVELIAPIAMDDGLRFAIREGGRTVGAGVVASIHGLERDNDSRRSAGLVRRRAALALVSAGTVKTERWTIRTSASG